jgi:hypothetical protein
VFKFRSNNIIVIPAAKTGKDRINKKVVIIKVQRNKTKLSKFKLPLPLIIVVIKLNLPTSLETPAT